MIDADLGNERPDFLTGGGEMAALIRAHDWSATHLGPLAGWRVEIKSVVAMMMQSPLPMVALFGEAGTMIYNDRYSVFAGARHPHLLGSEVRKGWPEVADFNDHIIKTVFRKGETLSFKDQPLFLDRGEGLKKAWLNLDYSPVLGVDGAKLGVIAIVVENTDKVKTDLKLQDERLRLNQMFERSPSFMALLEGSDHRFIFANEAYQTLTGHRSLIGKTVDEVLPEVAGQGFTALLDQVFATGVPYRANVATYDTQAEPGGPVVKRYVDLSYQAILDAQGAVSGLFVDGIDLTDRMTAQQAIEASEARFRTFAQVMPNHVWTARPDGLLDWVNERVSDYSGHPADDLMGTGWGRVVHPQDLPEAAASWLTTVEKGDPYETEFRIRKATGEYRWHLVRAAPIRDSAGAIIQWIGTNTDIDAQKQTEAETMRDRNRMWTLSQDLMLVVDFAGMIAAVNPSAKRMLGWEDHEMLGQPVASFLHPDDLRRTMIEISRLVGGARTLDFENRILAKDGSYRTLDWTAAPDSGRIHAIGRDVTELRRLSRDRDRIWNISPVVSVVTRMDGVISDANPTWTKLLGWSQAETIKHSIFDFVAPEDRARATSVLANLNSDPGIRWTESLYLTKRGDRKRIAWSIVADSGVIYGFGRDVTAESEAAAALAASEASLRQSQKMESIGQLTGGVAHDFNNLLQVIGSNLQLLTKDVTDSARGLRRVDSALEAVSRGARLVSQLLAFGRRQPLSPKVVNLGRLVRDMDEILRRALGEAIEIKTIVADGLWHTLVDPGNVENALLNLAINGRDAMEGRGNLTIELGNAGLDADDAQTAQEVTPGQYVMLAVTDTGTGIDPDIIDKVFEPFFTTKPEGRGTGLGLSMVYGFVKQSGGHVKIDSEPGHGTTIRIYLPRSLGVEDQILPRDAGPIHGGPETILVAEDDARVRDSVIETLTDLGYRVLQASDAQSAWAIIESGLKVDLLFTDVIMPGRLKSTELARMATARLPGLKVLFTSGYSENSIVHAGRLDPGVELLSKPYTREALARKVRQMLYSAVRVETAPALPAATRDTAVLTVLLCEDDALIRMATTEMLEDLGHKVIGTGTAQAALAALHDHRVDILMTDIGLPDMPGTKLARQVRTVHPDLPVIFATGHAEIEGFSPDAGTCFLAKPYDSAALAAVLKDLQAPLSVEG